MSWFSKVRSRFIRYPLGLKVISIILLITIAVMPFLQDLSVYYEFSGLFFCLSIISLCYSMILMNKKYAKSYGCSLKKKKYNTFLAILLLFLFCFLLFSSFAFLLIPIKKSLHIGECSPPNTQVGTTCCVLSNTTNAFCADEENPFMEKFTFALDNSIITENSTLMNKAGTFSFHPEDGYYIIYNIEMLDRITSFYLIKPINNGTSACEIKVSERDLGLTLMGEAKIVEGILHESNKITYTGKQESFVTDNDVSGYLLVLTSPSKPMRISVLFFNNNDLISFISTIGDDKYADECNEMFDKTVRTFRWED